MSMDITVVLPAYNEEACLEPLARRIGKALASQEARESLGVSRRLQWEIVVVDDGSSDGTAAVARRLARDLPLRVIQHEVNQGLGAAMRTGLKAAASSTAVLTMDADNTQDPALMPAMLRKLVAGADIVIASRFEPGGAEVGVPFQRKILSHGASGLLKRVAPIDGATDYSCGYRAYRGELIRQLVERYGADSFITENGFACMVELLLRSAYLGARVTEVPLVLRYDLKEGASKMRVARTVRRYGSVVRAYRDGYPSPAASGAVGITTAPSESRALRLLNLSLAALGLVVTAPVMAVTAIAIRFSSSGPVLARELRVGMDRRRRASDVDGRRSMDLGGRPFKIYRFRTREEDRRGSGRASPLGRPPMTSTGQILSRYHIDHLPELINVLRGDMNLVGPRAPRPEAALLIRQESPDFKALHAVRPGITGPAQLHTSSVGEPDPVEGARYDLEYVRARSFAKDVEILARTLPAVFSDGPHPA